MFRIVNTCNFGKDYPDEKFLNCPAMSEDEAKTIAEILNRREGPNAMRYWKAVESSYELAPAFQP